MELKGIKANFLGDSITEGVGTSSRDSIYLSLLARKCEFSVCRNYGISATRIAKQTVENHLPTPDTDFCNRFSGMDSDADLVVVFGGTNDFGHGDAPIGEPSDRTPDTFYGACHYLMSSLLGKYPLARIVIMTPLHRTSENCRKADGSILYDYVRIIREVAEYYSLPVLDLWSVSGIQPCVEKIREIYCPDGLHPNDNGHKRIAGLLEEFLKSL